MTESEISSFTEFYCENKRIKFDEEKLKKSLKGFDIESDLAKLIYNNYSKRNKSLGKKGNENGYLLNRQENLYSLLKVLRNKYRKRLLKLEQTGNLEEIENIKRELEENIEQITIYIKQLKKYKDKSGMISLCEKKEEKEILNFATKQYCNEVLRRTLIDYHRRIKPFVDKHLENKSEEITKEIGNSLGVLFNYKSPNYDKLEAQKQLKKYLGIIGDKYKETIGEEFISGEYVMLSSICAANNLNDLNLALYSYVNDRISNDQLSQKTVKSTNSGISDSVFYRGFNTTDREGKKDVINDFMINPIARSGRVNYTNWDMTNNKSNINSHCSSEGGESAVGSYTSFSADAKVSMGITTPMGFAGRVYYGSSFSCVYCIPENLRKQFFNTIDILSEVNGYNVPIEYRIFTIVFKNSNSIPPSNDIEDVKFCEKMDFVTFRLKKDYKANGIIYKQNQLITQDQLRNIIKSIGRRNLPEFLHNCLSIERSFDKFKVLGEEERIQKNEQKMLKTLEIEKRLKNIRNSLIKKEEEKEFLNSLGQSINSVEINTKSLNNSDNPDNVIEEEEESKDFEEKKKETKDITLLNTMAQNLSINLNKLNNEKKSETLTTEEINSIETPMEAYNKIIAPALKGISNIKIDNNSITDILNANASFYNKVLKINLKKIINKLPKENKEKLKNNLLKEGVKEKLNEMSKKSGIKLGSLLLTNLNKENSMVR